MAAHPRRLLSWRSLPCRSPSSGCSSGNALLARRATGTDALERLSARHHMVSRLCGSAKGMRREGSGTGTGIRVSLRLSSLLFLLGEERCRQPRDSSYRLIGVRALPCGLDYEQFPLRLSCGVGFSDVLTAYGPLVSGSHLSLLVA